MVGADGQRDYLLLFQNNAEIRATGGMPGSWAQIHAERRPDGDGRAGYSDATSRRPTSRSCRSPPTRSTVYGKEYGTYFQDPGFAPDFQRGAEMWKAHWERKFPTIELDGVLALDPVGMSYLLDGTGPVTVDGRTLTSDNVVEELLSRPYLELDPDEQDELLRDVRAGHLRRSHRISSPHRSTSSRVWAEPPARAGSWWLRSTFRTAARLGGSSRAG